MSPLFPLSRSGPARALALTLALCATALMVAGSPAAAGEIPAHPDTAW